MTAQIIISPDKCPKCGVVRFFPKFPKRPGKEPNTIIFKCEACGFEKELEVKE